MELVDFVQNKILQRRRAFDRNHVIFKYADYLLESIAKLKFPLKYGRIARLIYDTNHDFYIGKISEDEAREHLEYFASKIDTFHEHENRKNI